MKATKRWKSTSLLPLHRIAHSTTLRATGSLILSFTSLACAGSLLRASAIAPLIVARVAGAGGGGGPLFFWGPPPAPPPPNEAPPPPTPHTHKTTPTTPPTST